MSEPVELAAEHRRLQDALKRIERDGHWLGQYSIYKIAFCALRGISLDDFYKRAEPMSDQKSVPLSRRVRVGLDYVTSWMLDEIKKLEDGLRYWRGVHNSLYEEFIKAQDERDQARRHAETVHKNLQAEREKNEELNKRVAQWAQAWQDVEQVRRDLNRVMTNEPKFNSYVPEYVVKINSAGSAPKPRLCPHGTVWLIGDQFCGCNGVYGNKP